MKRQRGEATGGGKEGGSPSISSPKVPRCIPSAETSQLYWDVVIGRCQLCPLRANLWLFRIFRTGEEGLEMRRLNKHTHSIHGTPSIIVRPNLRLSSKMRRGGHGGAGHFMLQNPLPPRQILVRIFPFSQRSLFFDP